MKQILNYINGQLIKPQDGHYIDVYNPSNGNIYAKCPNSSINDLETAIKSAKKAQYQWANQSNEYRRDLLFIIANEIEKNIEKFAIAETIDN